MDVGFECPICLLPLTIPVFICDLGHSVCWLCTTIFHNCILCGSRIISTNRNYALEHLIRDQNYLLELSAGIKNYDCPFFRECRGYSDNIVKLENHLKIDHPFKTMECEGDFVVTIRLAEMKTHHYIYRVLVYHSRLFKFCLKVNHGENLFYIAVQIFDDDTEHGYLYDLDYKFPLRHNMFIGSVSTYSSNEISPFVSSFVEIPKYFFVPQEDYINFYGLFKKSLIRR